MEGREKESTEGREREWKERREIESTEYLTSGFIGIKSVKLRSFDATR